MKYPSTLYTLLCISMVTILFSCKKEIVYEGLKGELKGKVSLYANNNYEADYSGVQVIVDGSSPLMQTTTNENGEYSFKELKTGIYDLVFTKNGYGTYKIVSLQFIGGNVPLIIYPISITKLPDVQITDLKVDTGRYSPYNYYISVSGNLTDSANICLRYYVSNSPDVSCFNYQATDYTYTYNNNKFSFPPTNTLLSKFQKGEQLYMIVYPSSNSTYSYINTANGNQVYSVNTDRASKIVPFKIPNTLVYYY